MDQHNHALNSFQEYEIGYVDEDEEEFETPKEQLEYALEDEKSAIIIRDKSLGIRTVIWIVLGKGIRLLAVVTAIGSIVCSCGAPEEFLDIAKPLAMSSLVLNLGYYGVWHRTPLMKYKPIQHYSLTRAMNQQHQLPTILVRKPSTCTKYLNIGTCALALLAAFWGDFRPLDFFQDFKNPFTSTVEESPPQEKTMKEAVKEVFDRQEIWHMQV